MHSLFQNYVPFYIWDLSILWYPRGVLELILGTSVHQEGREGRRGAEHTEPDTVSALQSLDPQTHIQGIGAEDGTWWQQERHTQVPRECFWECPTRCRLWSTWPPSEMGLTNQSEGSRRRCLETPGLHVTTLWPCQATLATKERTGRAVFKEGIEGKEGPHSVGKTSELL